MKRKIFSAVIMLLLAVTQTEAGLTEPDGFKRVRIAEVYNSPAAQLLIMRFNAPLREIGAYPPTWQTLPSETPSDVEKLEDVLATASYDMIITGDSGYSDRLEERGLLRSRAPVWKERLILAGPSGRKSEMDGLGVPEIMSRLSAGNELFFSLMMDGFARKAEDELWKRASAIKQGENKGYVETSRDALSALLQAGDEGGFMLVGEGSFAQYAESERFNPALVKIADTDYFRVTYVCLMANSGFRKARSDGAAKYMEWLEGESARKAIAGFSIGGMNPFVPIEPSVETSGE